MDIDKFTSPLPIVDLGAIGVPQDGLFIPVSNLCKREFNKGNSACQKHYQGLRNDGFSVCPYGFSTYVFSVANKRFAYTSIIPWPRSGHKNEAALGKKYPDTKCSKDQVVKDAGIYKRQVQYLQDREKEIEERLSAREKMMEENNSMALHEIRKLNGTVKQIAEQLYFDEEFPVENKDDRLFTIFKASDMMSSQFDVIELLANDSFLTLPINYDQNLFGLIEKCLKRLYPNERIRIDAPQKGTYKDTLKTCENTFQIMITVLISNAIKYSASGSYILVKIEPLDDDYCRLAISNPIDSNVELDERVFQKGYRQSSDSEGTGKGLYLAQRIAEQHRTKITVKTDWVKQMKLGIFEVILKMDKKSR